MTTKTTKIYRVSEDEKDLLSSLRRKGENNRQMLTRLAKVTKRIEIRQSALRLHCHRFDFPTEAWDDLKKQADEQDIPIIRLIIQAAEHMKVEDESDHCHVRLEGLRGGHVFRHNDQVYIVMDKPLKGVCQGISKKTCLDVHNGQIREIDYQTGVEYYPDASIVLGAAKGWGSET